MLNVTFNPRKWQKAENTATEENTCTVNNKTLANKGNISIS